MKTESKVREAMERVNEHFEPLPMYCASENAQRAYAVGYDEGVDDALAWMLIKNPAFKFGEEADREQKEAARKRESAARNKAT